MTLLAKIAHRKRTDVLLAAEALTLLAFFRVCLVLVPVKRIIRALTSTPTGKPFARDPKSVARRVRWAVEAVSRNSPAAFVCFPQTLAGYAMLRRRHVLSTMVYGVARSPQGKLIAHTWLTVGDRIVLGGEGSAAFTPVERWT